MPQSNNEDDTRHAKLLNKIHSYMIEANIEGISAKEKKLAVLRLKATRLELELFEAGVDTRSFNIGE